MSHIRKLEIPKLACWFRKLESADSKTSPPGFENLSFRFENLIARIRKLELQIRKLEISQLAKLEIRKLEA